MEISYMNNKQQASPNPAAPFIKECARKILSSHQTMTVNDLKNYIAENYGFDFTSGQYAGALKTLVDEPDYTTIRRGVYVYNPTPSNVSNESSFREKINLILEESVSNLRKLAVVNLLQIQPKSDEIETLRQVIQRIENLKL